MSDKQNNETAQLEIYQNNLLLQLILDEIKRALGPLSGHNCLHIGDVGGIFGAALRANGGSWSSMTVSDDECGVVADFIGEEVYPLTDNEIPYENKVFDLVVLIKTLEEVYDDSGLIAECHRVLKNDGHLIIVSSYKKKFTLMPVIRKITGATYEKCGMVRAGYTEKELFELLKDGFDMRNIKTFSKFFVNFVDCFVRGKVGRITDNESLNAAVTYNKKASFFYRLAYQLDFFQVFRGFNVICVSHRRSWIPRKKPILTYNRSLGESVISRLSD